MPVVLAAAHAGFGARASARDSRLLPIGAGGVHHPMDGGMAAVLPKYVPG